MRNLDFEAAIWNLFTSSEFYEAAARECEDTMNWFDALTIAHRTENFGRNNQIYETFKKRANNFRKGAKLAKLGDYKFIWEVSDYIRGDVRGMMEQPLHSWMTEAEYKEFESGWISRLLAYDTEIMRGLRNAVSGAERFFDPDPDNLEFINFDGGCPGEGIIKAYKAKLDWYDGKLYLGKR